MRKITLLSASILVLGAASAFAAPENVFNPAATVIMAPARSVVGGPRNFLANPNFDTPSAPGWVVNHHDHPGDGVEGGGGQTAAVGWTSWVAAPGPGDVGSEVVPSTLTRGKMIHVKINGTGAGLVQTALAQNTGPEKAYLCTWVYVARGRVGIGAGNGGNSGLSAYSSTTGKWERLETRNSVSPANEVIIYGDPGSEFFVENVVFSDVWPPNSCEPR